jgi:hypothetical protein
MARAGVKCARSFPVSETLVAASSGLSDFPDFPPPHTISQIYLIVSLKNSYTCLYLNPTKMQACRKTKMFAFFSPGLLYSA